MYFLYRPDTKKYLTIHHEDLNKFQEVSENFTKKLENGERVHCENKFSVITDKKEIKRILDENFSSKNRGEEYTIGLPSATLISSALFPIDVEKEFNLLNWHNSISVDEYNMQQITNKLSTDSGEFCHEVMEAAFTDKNTRIFKKQRMLDDYIEKVCYKGKVNNIIENFDSRKEYFKDMAHRTLKKFFQNELPKIDVVASELFVKTKGLQGAIDLIAYKDKQLYILDHKTSKKSMSYLQSKQKGYWRQLYLYQQMLLKSGIISHKEWQNLKFQINFFNWNSCNSAIYEIPKEEVDKSKGYCEFILKWYFNMRDIDIKIGDVI